MLLLVLRAALAAVFAIAAIAKLFDLAGSREAVAGFGVPEPLARVVGTALPGVEAVAAALLLTTATARIGAALALGLLLTFIAGIARVMRAGESPDCHCFGQLHSEPAGASTLIRNAGLAVPAAIVLIAGAGAGLDAIPAVTLALVLMSILAAALALAVAELWRENRRLRDRSTAGAGAAPANPGLALGTPVPDLALTTLSGAATTLRERLTPGRPAVAVHISPTCGPCRALLPELARWTEQLAGSLDIVTVSSGAPQANQELVAEYPDHAVLLAQARAYGEALRVHPTPSAVAIGPRGRVISHPALGAEAIEALIRVTLAKDAATPRADDEPAGGLVVLQRQ